MKKIVCFILLISPLTFFAQNNGQEEKIRQPIPLPAHQLSRTQEEVEKDRQLVHENTSSSGKPTITPDSYTEWTCVGPYNFNSTIAPPSRPISYKQTGRVKNIQYKGDSLVVLAPNGGIWEKSGNKWIHLSKKIPNIIGAFTTIKGSNTYLVAGTGNVDAQNGIVLGTGIYYTDINSVTGWTPATMSPVTPSYINSIVCDTNIHSSTYNETSGNKMYCGTSDGLFYSQDQGRTWTQDPATDNMFVTKVFVDRSSPFLYYSVRGVGLYRKANFNLVSASTLIPTLPAATSTYSHVELGFNPRRASSIYAIIFDSNTNYCSLIKSYNAGATWQACIDSATTNPLNYLTQFFCNSVCVSYSDTSKVFLGGRITHRSLNGSFFAGINSFHADVNDVLRKRGSDDFWVASDGGIVTYNFNTNSYSDQYNSLPILESFDFDINKLASEDPTIGLATQDNGGIFISNSDDTINWTQNSQSFSDGYDVVVHPLSHDTMVFKEGASYNYSNQASTNSFSFIPGSIYDKRLFAKNYNYPIKNYCVDFSTSPSCEIQYIQNPDIDTWHTVASIPNTINNLAISPAGTSTIYYTIPSVLSGFYKRTPAAVTTTVSMPYNGTLRTTPSHDGWLVYYKDGYSSTDTAIIKFSTDYGVTFTTINTTSLPVDIGIKDVLVNPYNSNHVYLATKKGVFRTSNNGTTWALFDSNMPYETNIMQLDYIDYSAGGYITLYASTFGNSIWKRQISNSSLTTGVSEPLKNEVDDYLTLQQPYLDENKQLSINFFVGKNQNIELTMRDIQGRIVTTIKNGTINVGSYNEKTDVSSLSKGTYVVTLKNNERQTSRKFVL